MKTKNPLLTILLISFFLFVNLGWGNVTAFSPQSQTQSSILYVKPGASGTCASWTEACELQTALSNATTGDQIWVAAGTYKPTTGTDRSAKFILKSGVEIYGGFPAAGGTWAQRDWEANPTTLSGDIGTSGDNTDNSYHVLSGGGADESAVLDGFTVSGGNSNFYVGSSGGGMYNYNSSPTLTNIIFSDNLARYITPAGITCGQGGGMYNVFSNPILINVTFDSNRSGVLGGGMYNDQSSPILTNLTFNANTAWKGGGMYNASSSPILTNATFSANTLKYGGDGGGMYNDESSPILTNVTFSGNAAGTSGSGGGMYNENSSPSMTNVTFSGNSAGGGGGMTNHESSPSLTNGTFSTNSAIGSGGGMLNKTSSLTFTNVTFSNNSAAGKYYGGGGMYNENSSITLTNVTFANNSAENDGGGMYNRESSSPTLVNTILWGNTPDQINNDTSSPAAVTYSIVEGGYTGTGNVPVTDLKLDPTLADNGGFTMTHALQTGSPAIDTGDPTNCPFIDQRGFFRPIDGDGVDGPLCDIGAYEYASYPLTFSLTLDVVGSGSVANDPDKTEYFWEEAVILTASAESGWSFIGWSGDASGSNNPLTVTMDANKNVTATFTQDEQEIYLPLILR